MKLFKHTLTALLAISLAGCTNTAIQQEETQTTQEPSPTPYSLGSNDKPLPDDLPSTHKGTLERFNYQTYVYDGDQSLQNKYAMIYTPYNYDPAQQYDILYLMHGHTGSADDWLGSEEEPNTGKDILDYLIEQNEIKPMIVVSMSYYDHNEDQNTDDFDAQLTEDFSKELKNDIMPAIESHYSTYAPSIDEKGFTASRDHRIFGGFSMGGVTTWFRFSDSMAYFKYYMPVSGMLAWGPEGIERLQNMDADASWEADYLIQSLKKQGYTPNDFFVLGYAGENDFAEDLYTPMMNALSDEPDTFHFGNPDDPDTNISYYIQDNEEHNDHCYHRALYNALPIFSQRINQA